MSVSSRVCASASPSSASSRSRPTKLVSSCGRAAFGAAGGGSGSRGEDLAVEPRGSRDRGRPRARAAARAAAAGTGRAPAGAGRRRRSGASAPGGRPRAAGPRRPRAGASRSPRRRLWQLGQLDAAARAPSRAPTGGAPRPSPRSDPRAAARPCRARAPRDRPPDRAASRALAAARSNASTSTQSASPVSATTSSCSVSLLAAERAAGRVEHLMQAGRGAAAARPQQLDDLLAVQAPLGRQRQQLHQRLGTAQAPGGARHLLPVDLDGEAAQQPDAQHVASLSGRQRAYMRSASYSCSPTSSPAGSVK